MKSPEVFYLQHNNEQRGPYTIQHIDHLLNSGLITEEATFWREGMEEWQPVTNLVAVRRKKKRKWTWVELTVVGSVILILAILARIFGPITLDGWRESAQTDFTDSAAYWKARDYVRQKVGESGGVVQFLGQQSAQVAMTPPKAARVVVRGKLIEKGGGARDTSWRVELSYEPLRKEWKNGGVEEISNAS